MEDTDSDTHDQLKCTRCLSLAAQAGEDPPGYRDHDVERLKKQAWMQPQIGYDDDIL